MIIKLKYNNNLNDTEVEIIETNSGSEYVFPSIEPKHEGYVFLGWFTDITNGVKINETDIAPNRYSQVLYAHWEPESYLISFDSNEETENIINQKKVSYGSIYGYMGGYDKKGYIFKGWYTSKIGGIKIESHDTPSILRDHTLYARWEAEKYTAIFKTQDIRIKDYEKTITFGEPFGSIRTLSNPGYILKGWFTKPNGEGLEITNDTIVGFTEDITLFPKWEPNKYTVSFDLNGGDSLSYDFKEVVFGKKYGDMPVASKRDYIFKGWFTKPEGGNKITSLNEVDIPRNHILYASWSKSKLISFDSSQITFIDEYEE